MAILWVPQWSLDLSWLSEADAIDALEPKGLSSWERKLEEEEGPVSWLVVPVGSLSTKGDPLVLVLSSG